MGICIIAQAMTPSGAWVHFWCLKPKQETKTWICLPDKPTGEGGGASERLSACFPEVEHGRLCWSWSVPGNGM